MTTKNVRWKCEICGSGLLAPSRPRKNDVRRYCLPCSSKTGRLVERVAPSLEKQREAKKEVAKKKAASKRATVAKKRAAEAPKKEVIKRISTIGAEGFVIAKEAEKIWKLLAPYHGGRRLPEIEISTRGVTVDEEGRAWQRAGGHAGLAYIGRHRIWLKSSPSWGTLAHELVHLAVGVRQGETNRRAHDKVFYDCLRDVAQRRFKVTISFYKVTRYGYEVDGIICSQLRALGVYEIFKKKETK